VFWQVSRRHNSEAPFVITATFEWSIKGFVGLEEAQDTRRAEIVPTIKILQYVRDIS